MKSFHQSPYFNTAKQVRIRARSFIVSILSFLDTQSGQTLGGMGRGIGLEEHGGGLVEVFLFLFLFLSRVFCGLILTMLMPKKKQKN